MSRRRKRRRRRSSGDVELNLAAMLDMAFQLLTFFILTFRPSPIEGQLALQLPPPLPATDMSTQVDSGDDPGNSVAPVRSLIISIHSGPDGLARRVLIGHNTVFSGPADAANMRELNARLGTLFGLKGTPFEQVLLRVGPDLRYDELMRIVDVCARQKLENGELMTRISFVELPKENAAGP